MLKEKSTEISLFCLKTSNDKTKESRCHQTIIRYYKKTVGATDSKYAQ